MNPCYKLAPDKFQRYFTASQIVRHAVKANRKIKILDLGANESIIHQLFPNEFTVELDINPASSSRGFILGKAQILPFANRAFDVIIALDLLEHVKASDRSIIINEIARVTNDIAILSYPNSDELVQTCERLLNDLETHVYSKRNHFLDEHFEFDPVDHTEISKQMKKEFTNVEKWKNFDLLDWLISITIEMHLAVLAAPMEIRATIYSLLNNASKLHTSQTAYRWIVAGSRNASIKFQPQTFSFDPKNYLNHFKNHFLPLFNKMVKHKNYAEHLEIEYNKLLNQINQEKQMLNKLAKNHETLDKFCHNLENYIKKLESNIETIKSESRQRTEHLNQQIHELKLEEKKAKNYLQHLEKEYERVIERNSWIERKYCEFKAIRIDLENQVAQCSFEFRNKVEEYKKLELQYNNFKTEAQLLQEKLLKLQKKQFRDQKSDGAKS